MPKPKPRKFNRRKIAKTRLILIAVLLVAIAYVWFYACQHGQWAALTKKNKQIQSENMELEKQIAKKQLDRTIILSDEAVNQKASAELKMHRARINERFYLPDPREWKPEP
jgi:cell division protein FtsL